MPSRRIYSNAISETAVAFYDSGGHNHDGINSSLIDTSKYSLFDFNVNTVYSTNQRALAQERNLQSFKNLVISIVNNNILSPAGITLGENVINGFNIISRSITTNELATDSIKSLNYSNPSSNIYSDVGTFLDLDNGDIISSNFSFVSGTLNLKGNLLGNKTGYSDSTAGFFLGLDSGQYKINFGNSTDYLKWDGSSLDISGAVTGGTIDIGGSDSSSFHVDSSGNMWLGGGTFANGVFKVSSSGVLTVKGSGGYDDLQISTGQILLGSGANIYGSSSTLWLTGTYVNTVASDIILQTGDPFTRGNAVSVGFSSISTAYTVTANSSSASEPSFGFNLDTNTGIFSPSADNLAISTGGVERLRIQDNGNMLLQTSGATMGLNPPTGSGSLCELVNAFGFYFIYRDTSLSGTKENIQEVGEWLVPDMVDQINPMLWNRKTAPGIPEIGPMAEDMEAISPFLVACGMDLDENGDIIKTLEGINIKSWVNLLTIGLQDARARIAYLEDLVEQLQVSN
ncbi:MAG: hypothetical protein ACO397_05960 [Gammaproteobacteria bacterium]